MTVQSTWAHSNLTKDYIILQHIIIPIEKVLNAIDPLDRIHAGFVMALNHHTYSAVQTISEPLQTMVIEYIVQHGIQLMGNSTDLIPEQIGHSDQRLQEIDSAMILSQHQGYKLLNKKKVMDYST